MNKFLLLWFYQFSTCFTCDKLSLFYQWQTALKLLAGQEEELSHLIPVLLGCRESNAGEGNFIEGKSVKKILRLVEENAFSHLMEVRVLPEVFLSPFCIV